MPQVTLLQLGVTPSEQDAYAFDHARAHDLVQAAIPSVPSAAYFLDPTQDNQKWMYDHQVSSIDQLDLQGLGAPFATDLSPTVLASQSDRLWWVWQNHNQGVASFAVLPPSKLPT